MMKNTTKRKRKKTKKKHKIRCNKTVKFLIYEWCQLDLTSQLVLFIGAILLAELILSIFFYPGRDDLSINIVFRTGLASVMGYILGGMSNTNTTTTKTTHVEGQPVAPSVSYSSEKDSTVKLRESTDIEETTISLQNAPNIRALIATLVCIVCIVCLFLASTFNQLEYREGLIQMRDLISTTIGFLISTSRQKT